jgi:predicted DCC family thiol-disulfide oxidoreductase YuxK
MAIKDNKPAPGDGGIILFDGLCNLCESSVRFVIRHDPDAVFIFAPLQSQYASRLIEELDIAEEVYDGLDFSSFVLLSDGRPSVRSDAWLGICRQLDGWPSWLGIFRIVPRFIRDAVYSFIGRHRHRWFGRKSECMVPSPDIRRRFRQ